MHLTPQTLLQGRYRIHGLIAQGGMGAVYRATDERLGNTVALKQTLVSDPQLREAFEREARLLAGLHHPALPVVSDHFAEGSDQFLVMQFIPGDDLATLLQKRGGPFPLAELLPWADRLLDALDYLHSQRPPVIHRDIKPQNLKLTGRGEIILLDFGLAKGALGQSTADGQSLFGYTPQYAPLEQIQGSGTEERSDLYSAAATFYQLLTGEPPPDALTRATASVNGQTDPLRPASLLNPAIPAAVSDLLTQAMALSPFQRPASARAMGAALRAAAQPGTVPLAATVIAGPSSSQTSSAGQPTIALPRNASLPPVAAGRKSFSGAAMFWLLIAGMVVMAFLISAVVTFGPWRTVEGDGVAGGAGALTSQAVDPNAAGFSRANPLDRNATAIIPGWELEVFEVIRGEEAWRLLYEENQFNDPAPEGYEFVLVRMEVRATFRTSDRRRIYPEVTGAERVEYSNSRVPPEPALETELDAGQQSKGWLAYQIREEDRDLLLKVNELMISSQNNPPVFMALEEGAAVVNDPSLRTIDPNRLGVDHREPAALGDTAIMEDWEVSVREVRRGPEVLAELETIFRDVRRPAEGREYLLAYVELRYIGSGSGGDATTLVDGGHFKSVSTRTEAPVLEDKPGVYSLPFPEIDHYLYPGGRAEGWVIIDVPVGDPDVALAFTTGFDPNKLNTRYFALQ